MLPPAGNAVPSVNERTRSAATERKQRNSIPFELPPILIWSMEPLEENWFDARFQNSVLLLLKFVRYPINLPLWVRDSGRVLTVTSVAES